MGNWVIGGGRKGHGVVGGVRGGGGCQRGDLINVGNSRHFFVASPDNESLLKNSRHRVTRQFFAFASMTR